MRKLELTAFELAERFIGIKEVAGTVNNPQIMAMLKLDNEWPQNDEVPWCLAGNVEILTKEGFVRLDKYKASSDVACVDPSMRIEFGRPISVITKRHRGKTIKLCNRDFSLVCDDQHRFVGIWNKKNGKDFPLELRPIKDLTSSLFIPRAKTEKEDDYLGWEDRELSLLAAFLSDGFIHHDRISIQVSKNRKVDFLEKLCPIHKYEAKVAYGRSVSPLTTFEFKIPDKFGHIFAGYKEPSWQFLIKLSRRQLQHFVGVYSVFDGSKRKGTESHSLYTSEPNLRDWLQTAVTLAGYHSSYRMSAISPFSGKPCYEIVFCPDKENRTIRAESVLHSVEDIDLYCVEVPTGIIIVRDPNGTVIPIGNCSAFTNYICWLLRLPRSKSLMARSWLQIGQVVLLTNAEIGFDVVILKRGDGEQPGPEVINAPGHVGFYAGHDGAGLYLLAGNQFNSINVSKFSHRDILGVRRLYE